MSISTIGVAAPPAKADIKADTDKVQVSQKVDNALPLEASTTSKVPEPKQAEKVAPSLSRDRSVAPPESAYTSKTQAAAELSFGTKVLLSQSMTSKMKQFLFEGSISQDARISLDLDVTNTIRQQNASSFYDFVSRLYSEDGRQTGYLNSMI